MSSSRRPSGRPAVDRQFEPSYDTHWTVLDAFLAVMATIDPPGGPIPPFDALPASLAVLRLAEAEAKRTVQRGPSPEPGAVMDWLTRKAAS